MPDVDVLIVGAGLSGIGAAHRLQTAHPQRTYAILEARAAVGGTWDLFRFPGIRSDSDMFTLGYPFRPWTEAKAIADGDSILRYVRETAVELGIDRHIRFGRRVVAAAWSSAQQRWSVEARTEDGATEHWSCAFLYLCSGYYRYDHGYTPALPGLQTFAGPVVHPQAWPADLDVAGRNVVVVGSGATAVTLVPALAERGAHVTMLQRSPTWMISLPGTDSLADALRRRLPARLGHAAARWKNILVHAGLLPGLQARAERREADAAGRPRARAARPGGRRHRLRPHLRPVGPAAVRRARRRLLPRHEERCGRGRDRPDRHRHAHRRHVLVRPGVAR